MYYSVKTLKQISLISLYNSFHLALKNKAYIEILYIVFAPRLRYIVAMERSWSDYTGITKQQRENRTNTVSNTCLPIQGFRKKIR